MEYVLFHAVILFSTVTPDLDRTILFNIIDHYCSISLLQHAYYFWLVVKEYTNNYVGGSTINKHSASKLAKFETI